VHETIEEKAAVRAVSMVSKVQGSERGMGQQHGTAVCFVYLGHGGASRKLTGNWSFEGVAPPSWRCTEEWRGLKAVVRGVESSGAGWGI
jgi:hypothetical protein